MQSHRLQTEYMCNGMALPSPALREKSFTLFSDHGRSTGGHNLVTYMVAFISSDAESEPALELFLHQRPSSSPDVESGPAFGLFLTQRPSSSPDVESGPSFELFTQKTVWTQPAV